MKSFLELGAALQDAYTQAEEDQAALQYVASKAASDNGAAKEAYEAVLKTSDAAMSAASEKFAKSNAHLKEVQDEMNAVIGRFDPRVRQG